MADVRVRFIGDAASLRSFYAQLGAETRAFGNAVTRGSDELSKNFFNIGKDSPVQIGRVTTAIDKMNNTFRTSASTVMGWTERVARFSTAQTKLYQDFAKSGLSKKDFVAQQFQGTADELLKIEKLLGKMQKYGPGATKEVFGGNIVVDQKEIIRGNVEAWLAADASIKGYRATAIQTKPIIQGLANQATALNNQIANTRTISRGVQSYIASLSPAGLNPLTGAQQWRDPLSGQFISDQQRNAMINGLKQYTLYLDQLKTLRQKIGDELRGIAGQTAPQVAAAREAMNAARMGTPPIPADWQQLFAADKQGNLIKMLQRSGFGKGMGTTDLLNEMYSSNIRVVDDITRGVTRVSGSFTDFKGRTKELSVELDRNGKIVQRWGGNFRGISSMLGQTVRDFQKVIEWTIATTVVFAGLRTAMQGFEIIKDFDLLLTRFSITAQMTNKDVAAMFGDITNIAYKTATPLREMLTAMDDIAFGTKMAGQTSKEWRADMLALAEAVGIYTNLTGSTAEQSTELLVATMKQLGIEANEVVGILSKITVVSGGQSKAISDITQGLSVMAEAGQQAALSTDQMIAVIKTLSLVTSKTPKEVATAFKNLVGALDNPMALKALESYNIPVKDLEGNLRNIIDIYSEIQAKIQRGVIPASDVKMLIRQISGGPRRAPDAAALLANIGEVQSVTQQSMGATNQALLANSKILESINAQWTQLITLIQGTFFQSASKEFGSIATSMIDIGKAMVPLIGQFSGFIATLVKLGGLYLIFRGMTGAIKFLIGGFQNFLFTLTGINPELVAIQRLSASAQMQLNLFGQVTAHLPGRLGALEVKLRTLAASFVNLGKAASYVATGALIGGVMGAVASGGDMMTTIGTTLQTGGMAALMVGGPYIKLAGIIAMVTGSLMQMNTATKETKKDNTELARTIITLTDQYTEADRVYQQSSKAAEQLKEQILSLRKNNKGTADELSLLADYQNQYIENTERMTQSAIQLNDIQKELNKNLGGGEIAANLNRAGRLDPAYINKLVQDRLRIIFGKDVPQGLQIQPALGLKEGVMPFNDAVFNVWKDGKKKLVEVMRLTPENLKDIFTAEGKLDLSGIMFGPGQAKPNPEQFVTFYTQVESAIGMYREESNLTQAQVDAMNASLLEQMAIFDPYIALLKEAGEASKILQVKSEFRLITSDQLTSANELISQMQKYSDLISQGVSIGAIDKEAGDQTIETFRGIGAALTYLDRVPEGIRQVYLLGRASQITDLVYETIPELREQIDIAGGKALWMATIFDFLGITGRNNVMGLSTAVKELTGETASLGGELGELAKSLMSDLAGQSSKLQADLMGGQFEKGKFDPDYIRQLGQLSGMTGIQETIEGMAKAFRELDAAIQEAGGQWEGTVTPAIQAFEMTLTNVKGLEDATNLSTSQLIGRMFELAKTANLNKEQWAAFLVKMSELPAIIDKLAKAKVNIPIGMDLSGYQAQLKKMLAFINRIPFASTMLKSFIDSLTAQLGAINAAMSWGTETDAIIRSGAGNIKTGTGAAEKAAKQAGYLEIPDEFREMNRPIIDLVKEAVANAKLVQSQIPGEAKRNKDQIVAIFDGVKKIFQTKGIGEEYLRKAMQDLTEEIKKQNELLAKADTMRRIRVGAGDFAALANVPINAKSGISLGSPQGPITISLNVTGQILTPAQIQQLSEFLGAALGREMMNS